MQVESVPRTDSHSVAALRGGHGFILSEPLTLK